MYKKILVPMDGSELSERSLEHVKAIAKGCQVPEVVLLGVVEPIVQYGELSGFMSADWGVQAEKQTLDWLKGYLAKLSDKLSGEGINVKTAVAYGRAAEQILEYASKNNVDLVVMTTRGRSGVARWALGSVADRVVRYSVAPVLVVSPRGTKGVK